LFGENYLQEALDKQQELTDLGHLEWHFIGPIQSNKTRPIAEHFAWVHSVDRLKIAQRLNEQRPVNLPPLNICIQLNIDDEASKSGIALNELPELVQAIQTLPRLRLRGLMAIPSVNNSTEQQASAFRKLAEAKARFEFMDCLSMGMSADLEIAIANGATHVRVGTDIFGARINA
jgi:pyridoxal phosphate enzyme (YggS family)